MKVKREGGYTKITDGDTVCSYLGTDPTELAKRADELRRKAAEDIRRAERLEFAAVALQIDDQMAADRAAKQRRERSNATRAKRAEFRRTYGGS
jgi:hypothetical protein